ncbi:MAG: methyltransferase domain-containing protein, partial [Phycisphaerae bacterium]|nr:methyltransferase domain-containing protein [Phycisphaerae bacterium]
GLHWRPSRLDPVIDPKQVQWAGTHAANPKCVEVADGQFLLGFNGADDSLRFQLGLAVSNDTRNWRLIDTNPVVCTTTGEYRIESCFLTRDAWQRGDQRLYFFRAATSRTESSSLVLTADADAESDWVGGEWRTQRAGLYRISDDHVIAEPGAEDEDEELSRTLSVERDVQASFRIARETPGGGSVCVRLKATGRCWEFGIRADGVCMENGCPLDGLPKAKEAVACVVRVLQARHANAEVELKVWDGRRLVVDWQWAVGFAPRELAVSVRCPPGEPPMQVDFVDVWQPAVVPIEPCGDAHLCMSAHGGDDAPTADIDAGVLGAALRNNDIGRCLLMAPGSQRPLDAFDQIADVSRVWPGRIFPLLRMRWAATARPTDVEFQVRQLELLWQAGSLFGLAVNVDQAEAPTGDALDWIERRQVLTLWELPDEAALGWLRQEVLARSSFPVLLSGLGCHPLDEARYATVRDLAEQFPEVYLVTSLFTSVPHLEDALRRFPQRVVLGSGDASLSWWAQRGTLQGAGVSIDTHVLATSENLRFLTERVQWHRWEMLLAGTDLMFPPLPATPGDVTAQGFELVDPAEIPKDEFEDAKGFWADYGIRTFYKDYQPWTGMLVEIVRDLQPHSILEFGCNVGRNMHALAEVFPNIRLAGVDVNKEAVKWGREHTGMDLRHGDERTLAGFAEGEFDLVFTVSVLDHISDIREVCQSLLRCAARNALFLEVTLPVEGRVVRHFDHKHGDVRPSTRASYSWDVTRYVRPYPRVRRLDRRPCYLHSASLGPYYSMYLAFLDPPA